MRRLFGKIRRAKLGITEANVRAELERIEQNGPIDEVPVETLAADVAAALRANATYSDEWCKAYEVGMDWDNLFLLIEKIIEMLMPFIVKSRPPIPVYTRER